MMVDAAIILLWLICLVRGLFRGPFKELFSIVGVVVGLIAAAWIYSPLATAVPGAIGTEHLRRAVSFLLVFISVFLLLNVSGIIVVYLMNPDRPGWLIRTFGAGLGLLKGVLIIGVLLVPLVVFFPQKASWVSQSAIIRYENGIAEGIVHFTPVILHRQFSSHLENLQSE
jgi:membrane protein required for colicin V production